MSLKVYSKIHNIILSSSIKYPYDGVHLGGKAIIHHKGMNSEGIERDLTNEMEKWYVENKRVSEMLKTCSERGCGVDDLLLIKFWGCSAIVEMLGRSFRI